MRYVVLHHTTWPSRTDHYDLLLQVANGEDDDARVLKAFATQGNRFPAAAKPGARSSPASQSARELARATRGKAGSRANLLRRQPDHRQWYLHCEGAVSHGRGKVARVDEGSVRFLGAPEELTFRLAGVRLRGTFRLRDVGGGLYVFERVPSP